MSPQLSSEAGPVIWSNCSRKDITRFLDRNWGTCLEDHPSEEHEFRYPELPPGAMYNVDHQCRLQYGPEAMHCAGMDEVKDKWLIHLLYWKNKLDNLIIYKYRYVKPCGASCQTTDASRGWSLPPPVRLAGNTKYGLYQGFYTIDTR